MARGRMRVRSIPDACFRRQTAHLGVWARSDCWRASVRGGEIRSSGRPSAHACAPVCIPPTREQYNTPAHIQAGTSSRLYCVPGYMFSGGGIWSKGGCA
eukprot:3748773-Rhodomonas_salina.2